MSGRAWLRSKRVRCDGPVEGSGCVTKRRAAPVMHGVTCQSSVSGELRGIGALFGLILRADDYVGADLLGAAPLWVFVLSVV
jgi:hypothetical protein